MTSTPTLTPTLTLARELIRQVDQNCADLADQIEELETIVDKLKASYRRAREQEDEEEMKKIKTLLKGTQASLVKLQEMEDSCVHALDSLSD